MAGYVLVVDLVIEPGADRLEWARWAGPPGSPTIAARGAIEAAVAPGVDGPVAAPRHQATIADVLGRMGDPQPLIVDGTPYGAEALTAVVLSAVIAAAGPGTAEAVAIVHDPDLSAYVRDLVREAARLAGLPNDHVVVVARTGDDHGPVADAWALVDGAHGALGPIAGGTATIAGGGAAIAGRSAGAAETAAPPPTVGAGGPEGEAITSAAGPDGVTPGPEGSPLGPEGSALGPEGSALGPEGRSVGRLRWLVPVAGVAVLATVAVGVAITRSGDDASPAVTTLASAPRDTAAGSAPAPGSTSGSSPATASAPPSAPIGEIAPGTSADVGGFDLSGLVGTWTACPPDELGSASYEAVFAPGGPDGLVGEWTVQGYSGPDCAGAPLGPPFVEDWTLTVTADDGDLDGRRAFVGRFASGEQVVLALAGDSLGVGLGETSVEVIAELTRR
jgi:hypothetical protein